MKQKLKIIILKVSSLFIYKLNFEIFTGQKNARKLKRRRDPWHLLSINQNEDMSDKVSTKSCPSLAKNLVKKVKEDAKTPKDLEAIFSSTFYKFEGYITEHGECLYTDINATGCIEDSRVNWRFGISENDKPNMIIFTLTKSNKVIWELYLKRIFGYLINEIISILTMTSEIYLIGIWEISNWDLNSIILYLKFL